MKTALLFSIALSLFLIQFSNTPTRVDDFFVGLSQVDGNLFGDLVLASGVPIVVAAVLGVVKAVKK